MPNTATAEPNPGTAEPNPGTAEPNPGTAEPNIYWVRSPMPVLLGVCGH